MRIHGLEPPQRYPNDGAGGGTGGGSKATNERSSRRASQGNRQAAQPASRPPDDNTGGRHDDVLRPISTAERRRNHIETAREAKSRERYGIRNNYGTQGFRRSEAMMLDG